MAGHSAWKNIKHKKAAADAKRGKAWSKCVRAIIMAARSGGDPDANISLRAAIDEARYHNVPRDTIENAIKKGTGELAQDNIESALYEGYGPGGVAMLLEILTNNRDRTAPEIKGLFQKYGGNLGASGCAAYLFASKGQVLVAKAGTPEDKVMEIALEAGADDVADEGDHWAIVCAPNQFMAVRQAVAKAGLDIASAGLTMVPATTVEVRGETAKHVLDLIEALEDHDDVQKVHANCDIPEEELAALK